MSACAAMEDALGVEVDGPLRDLRRLIYCGEWIESHALHVYMLHAPDFLGYESAIEMAQRPPRGRRAAGSQLKKAGNELIDADRRPRDPPDQRARRRLLPRARPGASWRRCASSSLRAREPALETVALGRQRSTFPDFERDDELVSLREPGEYPIDRGRLVSNRGLDIAPAEFDDHVVEEHVEHSNALHSRLRERGAYLAGPLARYELNFDRLSPLAQEAAREAGLGRTCRNPFQSIVVRAVEILYAFDEALRIIDAYEPPDRPGGRARAAGRRRPRVDRGAARHALPPLRARTTTGTILNARIVPPTSQNQQTIEEDLRGFVQRR